MLTFAHSGDLGDIIAALPSMRQLGGGDLIIKPSKMFQTHFKMDGRWFDVIAPLLRAQSYLNSVRFERGAVRVDHDFSRFRECKEMMHNVVYRQARHVGIRHLDVSPWISVKPADMPPGTVIVNRTARNHNPGFDWLDEFKTCGQKMIFVGTKSEHLAFCKEFGEIFYYQTDNLLQVAQMIAGSDSFMGNDSCCCWIAMAMGHPLAQERNPNMPFNIIERENAIFLPNP